MSVAVVRPMQRVARGQYHSTTLARTANPGAFQIRASWQAVPLPNSWMDRCDAPYRPYVAEVAKVLTQLQPVALATYAGVSDTGMLQESLFVFDVRDASRGPLVVIHAASSFGFGVSSGNGVFCHR